MAAASVSPAEVVQALTWARTCQNEVVDALKERLRHYKGKDYFPPERGGSSVVTKEGTAVVQEAIRYVEALNPMGGVGEVSEPGLALAAEDHVADIGYTGAVSHASSDGTMSGDRLCRYGTFAAMGECLWYGSARADARCIVLDLIVDDGVESRGHRHGVYNPIYEVCGASYGPHATYGRVAAMEFAKRWEPNEEACEARRRSGPPDVEGQEESKKAVTTQWKSIGVCVVCSEQIKGGAVMDIKELGGKLHKDCFKCCSCSMDLVRQPFNVHEQAPFCKACYYEKHGEKCTACGKGMAGGIVTCSLGKFHVECVVCAGCGASIGKGKFSTTSGAITCQACAAQAGRSPALAGAASAALLPGTSRAKASGAGSVLDRGRAPAGPAKAGGARAPRSASASGLSRGGGSLDPSGGYAGAGGVAARGTASARGAGGGASPRPGSGRGSGRSSPLAKASGAQQQSPQGAGRAITTPKLAAAAPKAGGPSAAAPKATSKALPKAKPREKISLAAAGANVVGLGMDYGSL